MAPARMTGARDLNSVCCRCSASKRAVSVQRTFVLLFGRSIVLLLSHGAPCELTSLSCRQPSVSFPFDLLCRLFYFGNISNLVAVVTAQPQEFCFPPAPINHLIKP